MHPVEDIRGIKSNYLKNKQIVLGITGSIAAVETVKLSRELIRHGADVIPVMSSSATNIIHPDSLWFATGNKPIIHLTGETEHVNFCGRVKNPADLLLICPSTANTISKIAHGIDDTPVTTFATTAIGSNIPVLIVPAMHLSMYDHKIVQKNINKCKEINVEFVEPTIEKNKAKMPDINEIVSNTIRAIVKKDYFGKNILVIGGPTSEPIDEVRIITNKSSGKTAISLAKIGFYRGANIEVWYGTGIEQIPEYIENKRFQSITDLNDLIENNDLKKYDIIIICAAISDYITSEKKGKITSDKKNLTINLSTAPKIISKIRKLAPKSILIGYKLESNQTTLDKKSNELLKKNNLNFVVGNTTSGFEKTENEIWIYHPKKAKKHKKADKDKLSEFIFDIANSN